MDLDALAEVAVWYNHLRETSNPSFLSLFADEHRYLVLKGGGGSGKSRTSFRHSWQVQAIL